MEKLPRGRYTKEFREQAVRLVLDEKLTLREAGKRLSLSWKTLGHWVAASRAGTLGEMGSQQRPPSEVEAELARVKQERDLLKKQPRTLPRKSEAKDPAARYALMKSLRLEYSILLMCRVLDVSPSGFHAWLKRPPSRRSREEARLKAEIQAAHSRTQETYGPERLQSELADRGVKVGVHRIKRIRKELGLKCRQKRKFKATTDSGHGLPVADNLLGQDFATARAPNEVWLSDLTYIPTQEGWLYLVGHKDLFTGEIVGYAMGERMATVLVSQSLWRAVSVHRPGKGLLHHSGQPVLRPRIPETASPVRVQGINEPEGEWLG